MPNNYARADAAQLHAAGKPGALRRFFAGWKRFEEIVTYDPHEYVTDRMRALEVRVAVLESAALREFEANSNSPSAADEPLVGGPRASMDLGDFRCLGSRPFAHQP